MMLIKKICQEFRLLDIDFHLPFNKAEKLHMKWELNYPYIPWLKNSEAATKSCKPTIQQYYQRSVFIPFLNQMLSRLIYCFGSHYKIACGSMSRFPIYF